jgi:hypothetical protein
MTGAAFLFGDDGWLPPVLVAVPLLGAALVWLVEARVGGILPRRLGLAVDAAELLLAVGLLPVRGGEDAVPLPAPWLHDPAVVLLLLAAAAGSLLLRAAAGSAHAARSVLLAGAALVLLGDSLVATTAGLVLVLLAQALATPRTARAGLLGPGAACLLCAWAAAAILSAMLGHPAAWSLLAAGPHPVPLPPVLPTVAVLLLLFAAIGVAAPAAVPAARLAGEAGPASMLPLAAIPVGAVLLRLRGLADAPASFTVSAALLALGTLGLLLVCVLLRRSGGGSAVLLLGVQLACASLGLGLGGVGGIEAALLILVLLPLVAAGALFARGRDRTVLLLVLGGLPPFGLFAADFLLLLRASASAPVLALPVLAALALAFQHAAAGNGPPRAPAVAPSRAAVAAGRMLLVVLVVLGLAMPPPVTALLLAASEPYAAGATAGTPR